MDVVIRVLLGILNFAQNNTHLSGPSNPNFKILSTTVHAEHNKDTSEYARTSALDNCTVNMLNTARDQLKFIIMAFLQNQYYFSW